MRMFHWSVSPSCTDSTVTPTIDTGTAQECHVFSGQELWLHDRLCKCSGLARSKSSCNAKSQFSKSEHCREKKCYLIIQSSSRLLVKCFQIPARDICHIGRILRRLLALCFPIHLDLAFILKE